MYAQHKLTELRIDVIKDIKAETQNDHKAKIQCMFPKKL